MAILTHYWIIDFILVTNSCTNTLPHFILELHAFEDEATDLFLICHGREEVSFELGAFLAVLYLR